MKEKKPIKVPIKIRSTQFADPLKFKIVKDEQVNLTEDLAFQWLEMESFSGERPVAEHHVQFLYDEFAGGRFLWHHVILAGAELNGKTYRINGQHTCWMRVNIPKERGTFKADVRNITYRVDTEQQLRTLYSTFDRNKTRSSGHVSKVMLMDTDAGKDLPPSLIGKIVSGFKVYWSDDWHTAFRTFNPNEVAALISKQHSTLFNVVGHFVRIHFEDHAFIRRAAVIGAMFATFERGVQASGEFWTPVCEGLGLNEKSDPRWQLRNFLTTHGHNVTTGGSQNVVNPEDTYRVCINAWNKFRRKETTLIMRSTEKRVKAV